MSHAADELIIGYLADDLDQEQVTQLEHMLRDDPSVRDRFAALCRDDVVLRQVVGMMATPSTGRHTRRAAKSSTRLRVVYKKNRRIGIQFLPLAAAAMVAAVITVFIGLMPTKDLFATKKMEVAVHPTPEPQVMVKGLMQVVSGSVMMIDGKISVGGQIPAGRTLMAVDGEANLRWLIDDSQLTLARGSKLNIETGDAPLRLVEGTITAHISRRKDRPFTIVGPHATTSVMGTKFVFTAAADKTSTQVIEGRVSFHATVAHTVMELIPGEQASADKTGLQRLQTSGVIAFVPEGVENRQPTGQRWWHRATVHLNELQLRPINIRVDCTPDIAAVKCKLPNMATQTEKELPFYVFGNNLKSGNITGLKTHQWNPQIGTYTITAQPYFDVESQQPAGPEITLELTVVP